MRILSIRQEKMYRIYYFMLEKPVKERCVIGMPVGITGAEKTSCHNGKKLNSLDVIASEYGFSSRNAARYLSLNYLIQPFKNLDPGGRGRKAPYHTYQ